MVVCCIVYEIKRDIGRERDFFQTTLRRKTAANIFALFFSQPSQITGLACGGNRFGKMFLSASLYVSKRGAY